MPEPTQQAPAAAPAPAAAAPANGVAPAVAAPAVSSAQAVEFARSQQAFAKQQSEFKAAQDKWQAEQKSREGEVKTLQERAAIWELAKTDKAAAARKLMGDTDGWYNDLTEATLRGNAVTPEYVAKRAEEIAEQKVAAMRAEQTKATEEQQAAQKQAAEAARVEAHKEWTAEVAQFVTAKSDEYQLLATQQNAGQIVSQHIESHFAQTGKILTEAEAAATLETQLEGIIDAALKTPKYQAKLRGLRFAPPPIRSAPQLGNGTSVPSATSVNARDQRARDILRRGAGN